MKQLTLFDALPVESSIKPGNWVKLRRKSNNAAYWKKGEIVRVESVHPSDGSIRFWNERTEGWGYLYPDQIVLVPLPADSVSSAIAFDTESTPESVDTESTPESVDTESKPEPAGIDSVSEPIALDTESKPESVEIDSVSGPVSTYSPKGTARCGELKYFRFSYRCGKKMKHVHIPGGCTRVLLAQQRAAEVMELSAAGVPAVEICDRIKQWSGKVT
ncbi:MAG: hypothetical protein U7126_02720 [Microcoleus sp.]